ncbi:hypothetical protein Dvina_09560 [Dactylosporangium vinaceum]|uniref:Uncharacterized protein n=1 Tax=Dactylosporangium vinaceum TaxID=53362 RepID=A0ABV5MB18_9ACTN|nr:hypothetical protein [Dactylosporangium vinaceum]UAB98305.1 hypothetical protein Dvina_09560 [Dactylosporangium vinaceum]
MRTLTAPQAAGVLALLAGTVVAARDDAPAGALAAAALGPATHDPRTAKR